jgi:hypothetical protein
MESLLFHPKVVHLPIALSVLMPALTLGLALAWWRGWFPARTWVLAVVLQGLLVGSGLLALQSGEREEDRVENVVPEAAVESHEEAADVFVGAAAGVFLLMGLALAFARTKAGLGLAGVATLGTVIVLGTGYRVGQAGGELVYQHGAAAAYTTDRTASLSTNEGTSRVASEAATKRAPMEQEEEHEEDDDD